MPTWRRSSRYRDKALRDPAEPFLEDFRAGKQFFKISLAQQSHVAEIGKIAGVCLEKQKPRRQVRDQPRKNSLRQPVGQGHERMGVDGKPLVGRLHEEAAPAAHALRGELALPFNPPNMLDDGVAEDHVKSRIGKIGVASIAHYVGGPARFVSVIVDIQNRHPGPHREQRPIKSSAAHIEHGGFPGNRKSLGKALHPSRAEHFKDGRIYFVDVHCLKILPYRSLR